MQSVTFGAFRNTHRSDAARRRSNQAFFDSRRASLNARFARTNSERARLERESDRLHRLGFSEMRTMFNESAAEGRQFWRDIEAERRGETRRAGGSRTSGYTGDPPKRRRDDDTNHPSRVPKHSGIAVIPAPYTPQPIKPIGKPGDVTRIMGMDLAPDFLADIRATAARKSVQDEVSGGYAGRPEVPKPYEPPRAPQIKRGRPSATIKPPAPVAGEKPSRFMDLELSPEFLDDVNATVARRKN